MVTRALALAAPLALALALASATGCGSDMPPLLGDSHAGAGPGQSGNSFDFDATPPPPDCNVGVDGGVCACVDLKPLMTDLPNLYFVLDRSGSMSENNKWDTIRAVLADIVTKIGPRARFGAAVFPDPASDNCTPGVEVMSLRQGDSPAGKPGPTRDALMQSTWIPAGGGTPTASTLSSLIPKLKGLPGKTFAILATDGGPNCNGAFTCTVDQCIPNIENTLGCPPGGPPNCCTQLPDGPYACLDTAATTSAVASMASAGVPVYVVGVPGSGPYAGVLDGLATAGGTARPGEPRYYAVDTPDQAALAAALSKIAAKITATCTLHLDNPPPDENKVNVFFDGKPVPQAGPDGWTLSGKIVTLLGASCQKVLDGDVLDVRIVAGCPTIQY
jgi:hypothetical protein